MQLSWFTANSNARRGAALSSGGIIVFRQTARFWGISTDVPNAVFPLHWAETHPHTPCRARIILHAELRSEGPRAVAPGLGKMSRRLKATELSDLETPAELRGGAVNSVASAVKILQYLAARIRIHLSVGQRLPLLLGAARRAMTAHAGLSPLEMRQRFDKARWERPLNFDTYAHQVEQARNNGWAVDDGYDTRGIVSVSVPALSRDGQPRMACSATRLSGQYDSETALRIVDDLREIRAVLESHL